MTIIGVVVVVVVAVVIVVGVVAVVVVALIVVVLVVGGGGGRRLLGVGAGTAGVPGVGQQASSQWRCSFSGAGAFSQ